MITPTIITMQPINRSVMFVSLKKKAPYIIPKRRLMRFTEMTYGTSTIFTAKKCVIVARAMASPIRLNIV